MAALYSTTVLGFSVYLLLWLFFVYSCAGVLIEGVFCLALDGVPELRLGLLYLPFRPLYGVGGLACTVLLVRWLQRPVVVFVLAALICSVVEYLASLWTEKAFGTVSWDYGDKPLNLHGRICPQYSACWGLLALLALYVVDGYVLDPAHHDPRHVTGGTTAELTLTVLVVLSLLSAALTLGALHRTRQRVDALRTGAPDEAAAGPTTAWDRLTDRLVPEAVLIRSFPAMTLVSELKRLRSGERVA